jgi:hypothetical protein
MNTIDEVKNKLLDHICDTCSYYGIDKETEESLCIAWLEKGGFLKVKKIDTCEKWNKV